jgi:hypothetical protein
LHRHDAFLLAPPQSVEDYQAVHYDDPDYALENRWAREYAHRFERHLFAR